MGGCRCSYKDCLKGTRNSEEKFHFFHYPIKDAKRCLEWIKNAGKPIFARMTHEQLRNKVVCQLHFEDKCFTNENKRRLVHDAVPTLDGFEPRSEVVTVEILQSNSDANVFSLGHNNMIYSDCPTYFIHNGDIIPAKYSGMAKPEPDTQSASSSILQYETENSHETDLESESICWPQNEQLTDPLKMLFTGNGFSAETEGDPLPISVDVEKMSKVIDQHSRDIAKLNRTLKKHIFTNSIISKFKKKNRLINQLRGLLPPSLHAVVALHLSNEKINLSKQEKNFLTSLYNSSPSTYNFLIESCHWKLPPTAAVKEFVSNTNDSS